MNKTFEHLSASSIKTFLTCKRKFYLSQVEQIQTPSSLPATFGSVFHEACEERSEIVSVPEEMQEEEFYNDLLLCNALEAYHKYRDALPMQPTHSMREVCFQLNTFYKPIIGYMDVVDQYGEELVFGDTKTTRRNMGAEYLKSIQYRLYTIVLHGKSATPFNRKRRVEVVALRSNGKVQVESYSDLCGQDYIDVSKSMLTETLSEVAMCESANLWPSNMNACEPSPGEGWKCGFREICLKHPYTPKQELAEIALETEGFSEKEQKEHKPVFEESLYE